MRLLYCGDVVGKSGRATIQKHLPDLRRRLAADFVIVNGENAAHGFGITAKIFRALIGAGADAVITGNHVWDQPETMGMIDDESRLIRPLNYPEGTPGRGVHLFETQAGKRVLVAQVMGTLFMTKHADPFAAVEGAIAGTALGTDADAIFVDIHAEATSEKMAIGQHFDGRVSAIVGSHTHVPTADANVLPGGTAYMTDVGMCGDYDSVIGMKKEAAIARFTDPGRGPRLEPADGEATLCAVVIDTDDASGLARRVAPVRLGGRLAETEPEPYPG